MRSPGVEIGGGGTKGGGGENGGEPGQGCPVTGPQRPRLLAKLQTGKQVISILLKIKVNGHNYSSHN